jgi:hypothetical protein
LIECNPPRAGLHLARIEARLPSALPALRGPGCTPAPRLAAADVGAVSERRRPGGIADGDGDGDVDANELAAGRAKGRPPPVGVPPVMTMARTPG